MSCRTGQFSLLEQVWMQASFHGFTILGAIAIWRTSPLLSVSYYGFVIIGVVYGIMHLWVCPRCPHIKFHNACVQAPPFLTKWIIRKNVTSPLTRAERIGTNVVLYAVVLMPIFWVLKSEYLAIPYFTFALMHYPAYYLHFCQKCLNIQCPHRTLAVRGNSGPPRQKT
ncbi:MAG: hypothetical protein HY852_15170 [Bradyrhizobium sp.]|uniref:hypothetical protein n=1 Tax=Bradyrhizobium sp. TaxID=376 RepID=UPI0025BFBDD3|nr:hypothetical protein [Bradyrhizobium sp.]MBI5263150.1 hypothetical protein [Bradyrhizobium sp.]